MALSDLPIDEQVDEMVAGWWNDDSYDVNKQDILELLKKEYERGKADRIDLLMHDLDGKTTTWTISEPTPMNYTPNTEDKE